MHAPVLFRFGVLAFEVGERHIQRFVSEAVWVGAETWLNFRNGDNSRVDDHKPVCEDLSRLVREKT